MNFFDAYAHEEQARAALWLDVEPALCMLCGFVSRGVLLGVCAECLAEHDAEDARA